jgi:small conductance mechanosensitive channel
VINGFFILFENQYDIGDTVKAAGVTGTVEAMTLRRTVLRDANGTVHNVPNSEIKVVSNLTRDWAQVALHVVADYNENSDRVIKLLQDVGQEVYSDPHYRESLVAETEVPGIERVKGSEVEYLMLAKVRPGEQYRVSRHLRRRIKECFEENGIKAGGPAKIYVAETADGNRVEMK